MRISRAAFVIAVRVLKCVGGIRGCSIIGEEKTLSIKVGAEVGGESEDVILVRGQSSEVDRAIKEILQIVEDAKNDHILSGHVRSVSSSLPTSFLWIFSR